MSSGVDERDFHHLLVAEDGCRMNEVTVSSAATMEQPPYTEGESTTTGDMARPVVAKSDDSDTPPADSGSLEDAAEGCKNKSRLLAAKRRPRASSRSYEEASLPYSETVIWKMGSWKVDSRC